MLVIRNATISDIADIESMVTEYVQGHPAENHPRSTDALRQAYFGKSPVAHLLVAERGGTMLGMFQWWLIFDMFWGMYGAEAEWLYVRPQYRGSGVSAALAARVCAQARQAGARFLNGGGDDRVSRLYERVAIGHPTRRCHLSGEAFQALADLDNLTPREIVRALPNKELGLQPAESR
jgi:GNAT superfamily N-acetyltransferase